jgi:hypothetical protein
LFALFSNGSPLNHEITRARTALAKKNNPEQSPKTSFQPEKPLKAPEQKSGFIAEQKQKQLSEQKYDLKKQLNSYDFAVLLDYEKTAGSGHRKQAL